MLLLFLCYDANTLVVDALILPWCMGTPSFGAQRRHVFASFPSTPVNKGLELLRSPERWATGACLALGLPRFRIADVSFVTRIHRESMVSFVAEYVQPVLGGGGACPVKFKQTDVVVVAQGQRKVHVKIGSDIVMNIQINCDNDASTGFSLFIELLGVSPAGLQDDALDDDWEGMARKWIETTLFSLDHEDDDDDAVVKRVDSSMTRHFDTWRKHI